MTDRKSNPSSRMPGLYKLDVGGRLDALDRYVHLTAEERYILRREPLPLPTADMMVENVVGITALPLGVAVNFLINGRDYVVPMAIEESSVVAAASHLAKLVRQHGDLTAEADDPVMIGQIQVTDLDDPHAAAARLSEARDRVLALANRQDPVLERMGGGAHGLETRILETDAGPMLVVHLLVDVRDAMGANAVNSMAEATAPLIEEITGGRVYLRILTNLADRRLARARLTLAPEAFSEHGRDGGAIAEGILKAYALAAADPYRAATHNKGIMNAVDAVLLATGNDWRAVEAGAHAFACRGGQYRPLSRWSRDADGRLVGEIELPLAVGLVGGATKVHPVARIALKILRVETAQELAAVVAAVGLVQNLAALRSLVAEGIQEGHMILHAQNIAVSAGAVGEVAIRIANQMVREGRIGFERAAELLKRTLRAAQEGARDLHDRVERIRKPPDQTGRKV